MDINCKKVEQQSMPLESLGAGDVFRFANMDGHMGVYMVCGQRIGTKKIQVHNKVTNVVDLSSGISFNVPPKTRVYARFHAQLSEFGLEDKEHVPYDPSEDDD